MGLMKTVQTLGLILKNPPKGTLFPVATLVVCPKTVIATWKQQIEQHLKPGTLRVKIYAGKYSGDVVRWKYSLNIHDLTALVMSDCQETSVPQLSMKSETTRLMSFWRPTRQSRLIGASVVK